MEKFAKNYLKKINWNVKDSNYLALEHKKIYCAHVQVNSKVYKVFVIYGFYTFYSTKNNFRQNQGFP